MRACDLVGVTERRRIRTTLWSEENPPLPDELTKSITWDQGKERDLLLQLHHADVALGLVIVAWHIEVADESQLVSALGVETS